MPRETLDARANSTLQSTDLGRKGSIVGTALLVEYYNELPEPQSEHPKAWENRLRNALKKFKNRVQARYTEGTLLRLLHCGDHQARRAAVMALGLLGDLKSCNAAVASRLHDSDR